MSPQRSTAMLSISTPSPAARLRSSSRYLGLVSAKKTLFSSMASNPNSWRATRGKSSSASGAVLLIKRRCRLQPASEMRSATRNALPRLPEPPGQVVDQVDPGDDTLYPSAIVDHHGDGPAGKGVGQRVQRSLGADQRRVGADTILDRLGRIVIVLC